jgi:hypothetical protein
MSPRMRITIPRAPCGTAICTDRTIEPTCMMFPRSPNCRLVWECTGQRDDKSAAISKWLRTHLNPKTRGQDRLAFHPAHMRRCEPLNPIVALPGILAK